ncbi:hypothetical protein B0H13DRAFT_1657348 [Mycena leptocephala]|nr:hypothetical protein B0H13DRAFT_1657348 [Mycena leptocephala]
MAQFKDVQQLILDEILRRAGLGNAHGAHKCALCHIDLEPNDNGAAVEGGSRTFRCECCGEFLQCRKCCLERHILMLLHFVREWNGNFWEDITLVELGLVYQLGHEGLPCPTPDPALCKLVVVDVTGIHRVTYCFCGCDRADTTNNLQQFLRNTWYPATTTDPDSCATFAVLEHFRLLNVVGNVNAHDFITTLERKMSALGSTGWHKVPHAGRGHDPNGLAATKPGECMVVCWACPYDGRNLPPEWCDAEPRHQFLYRLILAMDANFKLKNRIRVNERDDPSLGPGWGAFVEVSQYKEHLSHYVAESDISMCIAFAALTQKETRNTAGLRVSGVGGCVCARHECMRANGLGDLQKGERYANMDYILMSALAGFDLKELTISYDVACQWRKRLAERMEKLPEGMRLDIEHILFQCGLPVWHALSHEASCTNANSLSFMPGVGKTDGEGIERLWASLNASTFHTKTMGLGSRADTLEDKIDYLNFMKNLGSSDALRRKLIVAVAERARQVAAFREVNKTISSEVRELWQSDIDVFLADRTKPNPYILTNKDGPSEAQIRVLLKKDEEEAAAKGVAPLHGTSATAFLTAGLQLEDSQRRIKAKIAGLTLVTADRESKIQEQRLALLAKLRNFRGLQQIYTPAAARAVEAENARRNPDVSPVKPENIRLYLPSELSAPDRLNGCMERLPEMEAQLREAQCTDALVALRAGLHAKRHVIYCRAGQVTGQHGAMRAATVISLLTDRINATAAKYNDARAALIKLKGEAYALHFKKLVKDDLTLDGDVKDDDNTARKKLGMIGAGKGARTPQHIAGSSRTVMSWIWASHSALDESERELHECESMRVEWARAKARKNRWEEEVTLLREEMRRILRYLEWQADFWDERATTTTTREGLAAATRAGIRAYTLKQANVYRSLRTFFYGELNMSIGDTVDSVLASERVDDIGLDELFTQGMVFCFEAVTGFDILYRVMEAESHRTRRTGAHLYLHNTFCT